MLQKWFKGSGLKWGCSSGGSAKDRNFEGNADQEFPTPHGDANSRDSMTQHNYRYGSTVTRMRLTFANAA